MGNKVKTIDVNTLPVVDPDKTEESRRPVKTPHKDTLLSLVMQPGAVKLRDAKQCGHPDLEGVPGTLTICSAACEVAFPNVLLTTSHDNVVPL